MSQYRLLNVSILFSIIFSLYIYFYYILSNCICKFHHWRRFYFLYESGRLQKLLRDKDDKVKVVSQLLSNQIGAQGTASIVTYFKVLLTQFFLMIMTYSATEKLKDHRKRRNHAVNIQQIIQCAINPYV